MTNIFINSGLCLYSKRTLVATACCATVLIAACGGGSDSSPASGDVATSVRGSTNSGIPPDRISPDNLENAAAQRAAALVSQLTISEKIQLVHGTGIPVLGLGTVPPGTPLGTGYIPGIPRLGIPAIAATDASSGVNTPSGRSTPLPAPIALAASWDPQLATEYGAHIATELRALGFAEGLGNGINLAREPRNGRTFEYLGEDPVLAGTLSAARTLGTQSKKVIETVKHYALNNQETNRSVSNSVVDERTLRETELLAFEIAIKEGKPGNVMCSHNKVNGIYACENPTLLNDILKKEWGFKGIVQSDWGATHSTEAAALAGLDEEQPGAPAGVSSVAALLGMSYFGDKLTDAVVSGSVPMARLDDMVSRKLAVMAKVGLLDSPPPSQGAIDEAAGSAMALKVAQQTAVLLKNDAPANSTQAVLPLSAAGLSSIVVIGGHADAGVLSGGGAGGVRPYDGNAVDDCVSIVPFGCATWYKSSPLFAIVAKAPNATVSYLDGRNLTAAAKAAANADVTIVFATQAQSETRDLASLSLPDFRADPGNQRYDQNELIGVVALKSKRTVVVLENGSPVLMPWIANVHAVLETWYPGIQGGQAIADLLFGDVNPSGKLPISFPMRDADLPQPEISKVDFNVKYSEGLLMGYRWYDAKLIEPLFPFGHGLSYTTFSYSAMQSNASPEGDVTVSFSVTNTGRRAGAEVAQVYAKLPAGLGEPPKRLVGWKKVMLGAGETQQVSITIPSQRLATWDTEHHAWKVNAGSYTLLAAGSSSEVGALASNVSLNAR
ncbi:glycoside hydrolase family 3 C-terminal domain-containing protein [Pararobbsia alpina]|uniref:Thermostable beta-glucosidase B n=1 Tax=Pararobbsia alpina TaxID=621374 RepID=A0A6S7BAL4_9BURK|nr:glycoside hydrolase family 3 C-terminal domain-containing protein [Pararobbsia alpina]CAB3792814.1 Thermostable beta-glucosidase B [Pararobbsia alpina]